MQSEIIFIILVLEVNIDNENTITKQMLFAAYIRFSEYNLKFRNVFIAVDEGLLIHTALPRSRLGGG